MGLEQVEVLKKKSTRLESLDYDLDKYFLEIHFGKLTRSQFINLKEKFGNFSQVPYSARREYQLLDFLHPAMQAVANQTFEDQYYSMQSYFDFDYDDDTFELYMFERNGISSYTNCWNTTLEITRMMQNGAKLTDQTFQLYWPGRWNVDDVINAETFGTNLQRDDLQYGDMIIVNSIAHLMGGSGYMLRHTAIALTPNLVFEKTDSSGSDPYRISLLEDVLKKYETIFLEENELQIKYKRLLDEEKNSLPKVTEYAEFSPMIRGHLNDQFPQNNLDRLYSGCETRLGGGCDMIYSEVHNTGVRIYSRTGRGILTAPQKVLRRFKGL